MKNFPYALVLIILAFYVLPDLAKRQKGFDKFMIIVSSIIFALCGAIILIDEIMKYFPSK